MRKYIKVGPFGLINIIKFAGIAGKRSKIINGTKAKEIKADFPINQKAKELHPDYQKVRVAEIVNYGSAGSKTYILENADPNKKLAYFKAGQYISLKTKIDGSYITRPYTISSSPKWIDEDMLAITIKSNPKGYAAEKYLKNLSVGDELVISGPQGHFCYEPLRDAKNVIAVAGGSGITPFLSMAFAIRDGIEDFNLTILFGNKNKESILFYEELKAICKDTNKVKVIHVLSDEKSEEKTDDTTLEDTAINSSMKSDTVINLNSDNESDFEYGFITAELIKKYSPDSKDEPYSVFICGPAAMYDFLDKELPKLNLESKYIRKELLGVTDSVYEDPDYPADIKENTYTLKVICGPKEATISAKGNEPVLVAIERAGIKAPSNCRSGECGYCRSKLVSGTVYVPKSNDGRRYTDIECNYIHPCASFPTSDLTIEIPGEYY